MCFDVKQVQTESYVKIRSADIPKFPKDRKIRNRQDKNHINITKYDRGEITRMEFIKRMCYSSKKNLKYPYTIIFFM